MKLQSLPRGHCKVTLRGHHLLCILGFRGLGYDEKFIQGMKRVVQRIRKQPLLEIEVIKECDDICQACLFNIEGFCKNDAIGGEKEVKEKDRRIAEKLGLEIGNLVTIKEILNLIKKKIKPGDLTVTCKDCPWLKLGYCKEGLKKIDDFLKEEGAG